MLRCEGCDAEATYGAVEVVTAPQADGIGEREMLRHHLLCSFCSLNYTDSFALNAPEVNADGVR